MDVILRVHREIVIHHVRNPIHVDAARGNVGRDQNADGAGLEILQRAQPLILRSIRMDRARRDLSSLRAILSAPRLVRVKTRTVSNCGSASR